MKELNENTIDWWLQKFEEGELTEQQQKILIEYIELDEVMKDPALQINADFITGTNKVTFTHLAARAKQNIELLAFDIVEGNLVEAEQYWIKQLVVEFPALENLIETYAKLMLAPNPSITFTDKSQLIKETKVFKLNRYVVGVAASVLIVFGITLFNQRQSSYQPRYAEIKVTPFVKEPLKKITQVKFQNKKQVSNKVSPAKSIVENVDETPVKMEKLAKVKTQIVPVEIAGKPKIILAEFSPTDVVKINNDNAVVNKLEEVQDDVLLAINASKENTADAFKRAKKVVGNVGEAIKKTPSIWRVKETKRFKILGTNIVFEPIASLE